MESVFVDVSIRGQLVRTPAVRVGGQTVVFGGGCPRIAEIHEEYWLYDEVADPAALVRDLRAGRADADLFTFTQSFTDTRPRHKYHYELENIAAIPVFSYQDWWDNHVSADLRKDIRRAEKRGVVVRPVEFSDELVHGIKGIYDELPVRQGRPFWHYQKDFALVKADNATYLDRAAFIGAFFEGELISFIKIVRLNGIARMMQIISKECHFDKRPANAIIAGAVRWAHENGYRYLTYGNFTYSGKRDDTLVQFKRRNGFEEIVYPRYYVPLRARGAVLLQLGVHRGFRRFVPTWAVESAKTLTLRWRLRRAAASSPAQPPAPPPTGSAAA